MKEAYILEIFELSQNTRDCSLAAVVKVIQDETRSQSLVWLTY